MSVFDTIYRTNAWNGRESRSGPGSGASATVGVASEIVELVAELGATSVLDVACGDGYWMPDLPGYLGVDIAAEAIRLARKRHPDRNYRQVDAGVTVLGSFDLVIVRDVIQHLSLSEGVALLASVKATGSRWLLASSFMGGVNIDISTGDSYSPDLTAEPFGFPQPDRRIFDGWDYADPAAVRDDRKYLCLW